jgi:formylglycine-generating enzyme required for sulfatase activity
VGPHLEKSTPVGNYAADYPHPWGLTDVHGNVCEWCADWYDENFYALSPKEDPECRDGEKRVRVLRGGSWYEFARSCRAACRRGSEPGNRNDYYGFRVVFCLD